MFKTEWRAKGSSPWRHLGRCTLAATLLISVPGCATSFVGSRIAEDRSVHQSDRVHDVTAAYLRERSNDIVLCVKGARAGKDKQNLTTVFSIEVPVGDLAAIRDHPDDLRPGTGTKGALPIFDAGYREIRNTCPSPDDFSADGLTKLPVERLDKLALGNELPSPIRDRDLKPFLSGAGSGGPVLYLVSVEILSTPRRKNRRSKDIRIAYVHPSPILRGSNVIEIGTKPGRYYRGKYLRKVPWVIALPPATVFDTVTMPVIIATIYAFVLSRKR